MGKIIRGLFRIGVFPNERYKTGTKSKNALLKYSFERVRKIFKKKEENFTKIY